jgi:hypothetical protein
VRCFGDFWRGSGVLVGCNLGFASAAFVVG